MKIQKSSQDYLESMLMMQQEHGYIRSIDLASWVSYYGATVTPRWGWLGGITLS